MKYSLTHLSVCIALLFFLSSCGDEGRFAVSFSESLSEEPLDGRLLLLISDNTEDEPRFQVNDGPNTQLAYGIDVNELKPGKETYFSDTVFGYPLESMANIPAGEYYVQALLHKYETFNLASGHTVKLPMDQGEGQVWNRSPGNLYSTPQKITFDPENDETFYITLDQEIPPIEKPEDTKYIKHVTMQSDLLTEFWGRPMYLGANVLLPEGFDEHPEAKYPICIFHGHFPYTFRGFREDPPDPDLVPDYSERFQMEGYNRIQQQEAHNFYQTWTEPDFPRMIIIEIQHQNPYYDDSYAVNSANLGPYGDAITHELIPYIEEQFRGIGEGWARFLYGGSTGGWEALAAQVLYPEEYNGCFAACPDPIDFRAYTVVDIYQDTNAYYLPSKYKKTPRPGKRDYLGHVSSTLEDMNHRELALGTNSRSGQQWDIWQAVYSPASENGYPKPIWNKKTGTIDPTVAAYWRENYDLRHILERDWSKLGPELQGKIHIYCGDMDNYYLNNAVMLMEEFLVNTENPHYDGEVAYGDGAEHCWNGDPEQPNAISRLRYNTMYVPKILDRIKESAPSGADLTSWRY
ncbi:alpha/beta hydrolase-fold protein [Tunicatimonas pelagia]|uniref:alpha/beta hydrolase-fold protein n=1 Tax=Tunicatimonas pelagia TaxID=931531 RepID=UPI002666A36D|nr:alpha/beta hydrolase-fold protein [Tunicatimonas pelagia]WKN44656.1 alpha/beta hydrolase-fold protein [Tunicatimonas pelagia]